MGKTYMMEKGENGWRTKFADGRYGVCFWLKERCNACVESGEWVEYQPIITKKYRQLGRYEKIEKDDFSSTNEGKTLDAITCPFALHERTPSNYVPIITIWREIL